jgi:chemotaxis protein MotB
MPAPKNSEERASTIVLKRIKKHGHGHHGGAWKIAYADFVTAMMAFFLLMWLLGSTTKADKQGISDYFNTPLTVALTGGSYSGGGSTILPGGGKDITRPAIGDVQNGGKSKRNGAGKTAAQQAREEDAARLQKLKSKIEALIEQNPKLNAFKSQIKLDITSEGLRIQIIDEQNRPMFPSGSSVLAPYSKAVLDPIGRALNDVENRVSIAGHTDSQAYGGGETGFSNWELSTERASAARRELVAGGMGEKKVLQVRGLADALPLYENDPAQPGNRRISILVLNKQTQDAFFRDGGRIDVSTQTQAAEAVEHAAARRRAGASSSAGALPATARNTAPDDASGARRADRVDDFHIQSASERSAEDKSKHVADDGQGPARTAHAGNPA